MCMCVCVLIFYFPKLRTILGMGEKRDKLVAVKSSINWGGENNFFLHFNVISH